MTFLPIFRFDDTFLNKMFESNLQFRINDFSKEDQTNKLMEPFYKNINYLHVNYPETTKMVLKSSASLNFHMKCHFSNKQSFTDHNYRQKLIDMAKIYDTIRGGSIENDKGIVIATWAEIPTKYMIVIFDLK